MSKIYGGGSILIRSSRAIDREFIVDVVGEKLRANFRLARLMDYYEGRHDILLRHYGDPSKPNNRIVVNYCRKIADFLTAYLVGAPMSYEGPQAVLDALNYNDAAQSTQEIVRYMNIMGFGAELFYTDEDGVLRFTNIDPRESIFVCDDTVEEDIRAFIRLYPSVDEPEIYNITVYTAEDYTNYSMTFDVGELIVESGPFEHYFGDVPAVIYHANPEMSGAFEGIISLQNAINTVMSDNVNDFESFVDSYLVLRGLSGTRPEDVARMKQDRILMLDADSGAEWLIKNVNNTHIKELEESIITKIHELGCIPDVANLGSFGASGVSLRFKLLSTDIAAAKMERSVSKGVARRLELMYNILRIRDPEIGEFTDVKVSFARNFIMELDAIERKQADMALVEKGILSRETFLKRHMGMGPSEAEEEVWRIENECLAAVEGPL